MASLDIEILNQILEQAIEAVNNSKEEIFRIAEDARVETERLDSQLKELQKLARETAMAVDRTEKRTRYARTNLAQVSRDFRKHSEEQIKHAYEIANACQTELLLLRQKESELRRRRDELEMSLVSMNKLVNRAEELLPQVGMAMEMLTGSWTQVDKKLRQLENWQQLGAKIISAQEEERRRIARDLHDGPVQTLAGISLRTELCQRLLGLEPKRLPGELLQLERMVKESTSDLRKIIFNLRPFALDDLGLVPALTRMFERLKQDDGFQVEFVVHGDERRFESASEVSIYRIIQEALNNVQKHAEVNNAVVKMEFLNKGLRIQIRDHGCGFKSDHFSEDGHGIITMRERAELLGGTLSIYSDVKCGTTVELTLKE